MTEPMITLQEAQARLPELVAGLRPGERLVITQENRPVAELTPLAPQSPRPQFGSCKGSLTIVQEDDEHLADFKEYMP